MMFQPFPVKKELELKASWVGDVASSRLGARGRGWVHSLYGEALNIVTPKGLVSLVASQKGRGPLNVVLADNRLADLRGVIESGSLVTFGEGCITAGERIRVNLDGAAIYNPSMRFRRAAQSPSLVVRNIGEARKLILGAGHPEGLGALLRLLSPEPPSPSSPATPFVAFALPSVKSLMLSLHKGDPKGAVSAARGLFGLGVGLTPSGDDLVAGTLVALILGSKNGVGGPPLLSEAAIAIASASERRTTLLSREYVNQASLGKSNEAVVRFVEDIFAGTYEELRKSLIELLAFGATSGTDIAAGVVIGASIALGDGVGFN